MTTPTSATPPPQRTSAMTKLFMRSAVSLYRLTGGAIGANMGQEQVLLLTTTGRKSGQQRTIPVSYFEDSATLFVIASNAGRENHPAWYLNLTANPQAEVQIKRERRKIIARTATGDERDRLLAYATAKNPRRNEQLPTTRQIPIVVLEKATN